MAEINTTLVTGISAGVLGAALGVVGGYIFAKKKLDVYYTELRDQEVASVRSEFEKLNKVGAYETPETAAQTLGVVEVELIEGDVPHVTPEEDEAIQTQRIAYDKLAEDLGYSEPVDPETTVKIVTIRSEDRPYEISHAEYTEEYEQEHEKINLHYYEGDDTLAGDDQVVIRDIERVVGLDALTKFGARSLDRDTVYVRNELMEADYEVHRTPKSYTESVLGIDPERQKMRSMKDGD